MASTCLPPGSQNHAGKNKRTHSELAVRTMPRAVAGGSAEAQAWNGGGAMLEAIALVIWICLLVAVKRLGELKRRIVVEYRFNYKDENETALLGVLPG